MPFKKGRSLFCICKLQKASLDCLDIYTYILGIYSIFNKANYTSKKTGPKDQGENQSDPYLKAWPKLLNEVAEVAEGHQ